MVLFSWGWSRLINKLLCNEGFYFCCLTSAYAKSYHNPHRNDENCKVSRKKGRDDDGFSIADVKWLNSVSTVFLFLRIRENTELKSVLFVVFKKIGE